MRAVFSRVSCRCGFASRFAISTLTLLLVEGFCLSRTVGADPGDDLLQRINELRGIHSFHDQKKNDEVNKKLDATWEFLTEKKVEALPLLDRELRSEIAKPAPDNFFLLDVGFFLLRERNPAGDLPSLALARIDPSSEVIRANFKEFFDYAYALSKNHDEGTIQVIDRIFLAGTNHVAVPQHALDLDPTLVCVFLYGPYGPSIEKHLWEIAGREPQRLERILEILGWIGTRESVDRVAAVLASRPRHETVERAVGFLMRLGGPEGRDKVLGLVPSAFDKESAKYLAKIQPEAKKQTYKPLAAALESAGRSRPPLTPDEVQWRLARMLQNDGEDSETQPADILEADLPSDAVVARLLEIRARMFFRLSDEALSDVEMTNAIINALAYKRAESNPSQ